MGLDLYAGTLTRYYARSWKTSTQQWAEENGYTYNRVGPDGPMEQEQKPDPGEVRAAMESWRDAILALLANSGTSCPSWPEDNEAPYYTDKPDWDAWCALLLAASCGICGEEIPATVAPGFHSQLWDLPVIQRAAEQGKGSLLAGAELWLPFPEPFWFRCQNPLGKEVVISTTAGLKKELEHIREMLWRAVEEPEILDWITTEGYPVNSEMGPDGMVRKTVEHQSYDTLSLARLAYSILYRAVRFSEEKRVPIVLDY